MLTSRTISSLVTVMVVVCIAVWVLPIAHARSAEGYGRMERLLASIRGGADSMGHLGELTGAGEGAGHPLEKRQIYDRSCKGLYDRRLFSDLDHVCDDCYNLYRNSRVANACRENCYSNLVFRQCMEDLLLMDQFDKYARAVQTVGKK
uniref:CPRP/cHH n=1 Tax=Bythograea thermydron TaxID=118381 RepID=Q9BKJ5_BYTTH|nr:CPRP/cHH precursor [Bythograea thermydron]